MNGIEEIAARVDMPPVTQIGVVVRDLDRAMDYYTRIFGLGPFNPVFELVPETCRYMGEECSLRLRIGRTEWGSMDFELVQPLEGRSIHQDFLDTQGEGLHHLGIDVRDFDGFAGRMKEGGFEPLQELEVYLPMNESWAKACYFDTRKVGGVIIEALYRPWLNKG